MPQQGPHHLYQQQQEEEQIVKEEEQYTELQTATMQIEFCREPDAEAPPLSEVSTPSHGTQQSPSQQHPFHATRDQHEQQEPQTSVPDLPLAGDNQIYQVCVGVCGQRAVLLLMSVLSYCVRGVCGRVCVCACPGGGGGGVAGPGSFTPTPPPPQPGNWHRSAGPSAPKAP